MDDLNLHIIISPVFDNSFLFHRLDFTYQKDIENLQISSEQITKENHKTKCKAMTLNIKVQWTFHGILIASMYKQFRSGMIKYTLSHTNIKDPDQPTYSKHLGFCCSNTVIKF